MPHGWFKVFLPRSLTSQWTSFTNHKALLSNADQEVEVYTAYTQLTYDEFRKHIGIYMVHGLAPSPQVSMKSTLQEQDEINRNDFVKHSLGPAATRCHKHFCRFFATQCPVKPDSTCPSKPNWKLELLLKWIKSVSQKARKLGENILVDEQTCGLQGRHPCKLRITYKHEGDGSQCDALCGKHEV